MTEAIWEARVRKEIDAKRDELEQDEQDQFQDWLRVTPEQPIDRWRNIRLIYSTLDLTDILGRVNYCHDFVRDALRYYLHHIVNCEGKRYEDNALGLAQLVNYVYYIENDTENGEEIINEVLDAVISALSKFPRWMKVDFLTKVIVTGCSIYIAVRLFNGFESVSEPLPRALLQSAAFTKDQFYVAPIQEGYSVATRIMGWGSNRLSNLGCHEGSSVEQKNMITLPRFEGYRVTAFSIGVNHSLFFTDNMHLYVTGRLKNWTGRCDDERIALTPFRVDLPTNAIPSRNLQCNRIYAGTNRSEIILSYSFLTKKKQSDFHIIAGPCLKGISKDVFSTRDIREFMRDERLTAAEPYHTIITNFHAHVEILPIRFKGSKKNKLDIEITVDHRGGFFVSDSSKSLPREMRICVGNVVHRPYSILQTAFCDNGDVFCLLQVDKSSRNYVLVKGEIRRLKVDTMEWTNKKTGKEKKDEQYYLVAEQIPGAEHVVQFSVDRNGNNLLFEIRDQPRVHSFIPRSSSSNHVINANDDPQVCYGGATRSLNLLQRERDCGNVMVDEEQLISLLPHSNFFCPRAFLSKEMMEDLKEETPIDKRDKRGKKKGKDGCMSVTSLHHRDIREALERGVSIDKGLHCEPIPDRYYGASFENGSIQLCIPRSSIEMNMKTKQYEDRSAESVLDLIDCYAEDLFPFHYPNGVKACITGRSEAYTFVTVRPESLYGSLDSEAKLRGLKMLRVAYNGQHEFDIAENLWELHTPHFNRSVFHSSAITPVVDCPFPESLMRMCERTFIDPSSTENYTTNQLLNMLDVADYLCANLLARDVIYRLLRNATRADINEILGEILQTLNSRSSLVYVLSRFPHILIDWPIDIDADILYETCERMKEIVGPVLRGLGLMGFSPIPSPSSPIPSHCNLSLFILASQNCELAVGLNDLPLSTEPSRQMATRNVFSSLPSEDTLLNLIDREDRFSLLFDSFGGDKGIIDKSKKIIDEYCSRYDNGGGGLPLMLKLENRISIELESFLTTVPSHDLSPVHTPKEKPSARRTRRNTERKSEREEKKDEDKKEKEEAVEEVKMVEEMNVVEEKIKEVSLNNNSISPVEKRKADVEIKVTPRPLADIIKEEEEIEAARRHNMPKKTDGRDGGKRSKFRPLSFSDSSPSTSSKHVDTKHDWIQIPRQETSKEKQSKSFTEIMKEQSEKKSGISRRRGPSVSGCQMEAAAIEALSQLYREMIEDHQIVTVEVCSHVEEAPRWNADGDLYLE